MHSLKDLQIWNAEHKQLQNIHLTTTVEFRLVQAIIACFEEAEEEGYKAEMLVSTSRVVPLTYYRGFLMVNICRAIEKFTNKNKSITAKIFYRDRTTLYNYLDMDKYHSDSMYEVVRNSPFAERVTIHLNSWVDYMGGEVLPLQFSEKTLISLVGDCSVCREKVERYVRGLAIKK